jgi:hypothetical protein
VCVVDWTDGLNDTWLFDVASAPAIVVSGRGAMLVIQYIFTALTFLALLLLLLLLLSSSLLVLLLLLEYEI